MGQVTGRARIYLKGNLLTSKPGAKLTFGGVKRDTVLADTGVAGFTESTVAPEIECTVPHDANTSLQDYADFKDGSVMFETDTGKVFTVSGAWLAEPPTLTNGEVPLKFAGITCVES
jgi:hypothetical protein